MWYDDEGRAPFCEEVANCKSSPPAGPCPCFSSSVRPSVKGTGGVVGGLGFVQGQERTLLAPFFPRLPACLLACPPCLRVCWLLGGAIRHQKVRSSTRTPDLVQGGPILVRRGPIQVRRRPRESHRVPQSPTGSRRVSQGPTESHRVSQSSTGSQRVPESPTASHRVPQGTRESHSVPQSPTGSRRVTQGPTESHRVPQSPTE
jgi:hypothetical protein